MESEMRREQAFHPEVDLKILRAQNNSETQIDQIRQLISEGVDLLIVSPNESEPLTPVIEEVYKSGIPVILIDRKTESEQYTAYIGADNYEIGETAAKYIATQFGGKANVIELQLGMTMTPARDRSRGFAEGLVKYPGITILTQMELTRGPEALKPKFQEALRRHSETEVVFAHNDFLAESAYNWAKEINRNEELFFVELTAFQASARAYKQWRTASLTHRCCTRLAGRRRFNWRSLF